MADSLKFVVFLNFATPKGKKLHKFLFQSSNLIYWYKKLLSHKRRDGEFF